MCAAMVEARVEAMVEARTEEIDILSSVMDQLSPRGKLNSQLG